MIVASQLCKSRLANQATMPRLLRLFRDIKTPTEPMNEVLCQEINRARAFSSKCGNEANWKIKNIESIRGSR